PHPLPRAEARQARARRVGPTAMAWRTVTFELDVGDAEAVSDALLEAGAASVDAVDAEVGPEAGHAESGEASPGAAGWRRARITALLEAQLDPHAVVRDACGRAGVPVPALTVGALPERD